LGEPFETMPVVNLADYTYNGDGTLCERVKIVGGPLDGMVFSLHTYVDTNGMWVFVTRSPVGSSCRSRWPGCT